MAAKSAPFPLNNSFKPKQGPYGLSVPFDFRAGVTQISGDLAMESMSGQIEFVQSIFVDNRLNGQPFVITFSGLQYTIQVKAGRQGIWPVLSAAGFLSFSAVSPGGIIVPTIMFNVVQPYFFWDV